MITTRFGDELRGIDVPVLPLDEIPDEHVRAELAEAGVDLLHVDDSTMALMRRPMYFAAWRNGRIQLSDVRTPHDIYRQLVASIEASASEAFGFDVALAEFFGRLAFGMIDAGELAVPAAQVYADLQSALPVTENVADFVNYLISTGTLLATPSRRLAFFHHSIAEYFAAHYLTSVIAVDRGMLRHCLGRRSWDTALLLTLGFLEEEQAKSVFDEVVDTDIALAARSINFIDYDRHQWIERVLDALSTPQDWHALHSLDSALRSLRVLASNVPTALRVIAMHRGMLSQSLLGCLWRAVPEATDQLLDLILDKSDGYAGLYLCVHVVKDFPPTRARKLLEEVGDIDLSDEDVAEIREGDTVDKFSPILHFGAQIISVLPISELLEFGRRPVASPLVVRCISYAIKDSRTPEVLKFLQERIVAGDRFAIFELHSALSYGKAKNALLVPPEDEVVTVLLEEVRLNQRSQQWAVLALESLVSPFETVRRALISDSYSGLMAALVEYVRGDHDRFFEALEALARDKSFGWEEAPTEALTYLKLSWRGRENILLEVLGTRNVGLAEAVISSVLRPGRGADVQIRIEDVDGWLDWMAENTNDGEWFNGFCNAAGEFLATATDIATCEQVLVQFNDVPRHRAILAEYVLKRMQGVYVDQLSAAATEWLIERLRYDHLDGFEDPLLARVATESFVQGRLLPLLLESRPGEFQSNLLVVIKACGNSHRRRYVGDDGRLLG